MQLRALHEEIKEIRIRIQQRQNISSNNNKTLTNNMRRNQNKKYIYISSCFYILVACFSQKSIHFQVHKNRRVLHLTLGALSKRAVPDLLQYLGQFRHIGDKQAITYHGGNPFSLSEMQQTSIKIYVLVYSYQTLAI